jgi:hypothetical protein
VSFEFNWLDGVCEGCILFLVRDSGVAIYKSREAEQKDLGFTFGWEATKSQVLKSSKWYKQSEGES